MRYYCPNCRQDFWEVNFAICPACGYKIDDFDKKDYVDKLINALGHSSGEVRHWAVMILAQKRAKQVLPHLEKLLLESKDPSLVKAAKEAIKKINSQD